MTKSKWPVAITVALTGFVLAFYALLPIGGYNFALGGAVGRSLVLPLLIVALFQIGRGFRDTDSRLKIFIAVSVVVAIISAGMILTRPSSVSQRLQSQLDELNSSLPAMVDEGLRLDSYEADGDILIMNITTVGVTAAEIDVESWMSESRESVADTACADPNYRQILDAGVTYEYRYRDEEGTPVVTIPLSLTDCR